ncbi:MAG: ABC transporter ATP-binding protein [Candidatus Bathyarchaeota archaeon]|nr:ABC transporter ATP-binding protein [Candidatus Bathyarchaeota archaeon]MDH5595880.1 ABC transporter ATP-binding protein [Candidatus Bathyarchaeota archaeon]
MARVSIKDLTKRFGNVVAVNKLDLEVRDKEFVVLLGPSGCGKTTALRCIAGLETPDEGEIYIGDRLVNDLDPKERDIAMVFQSYALYPHMKVFDNLAFPLENAKVPKDEIKNRVQEVAELLKIENLLNRKPKQLSGGQRQRVALGRAMVREPHVFLMDEPLSNLDAKLRVHMRTELKKLQRDVGITTIYVTHDQVEAMTMGDKVAILDEGILQQFGHPHEIYFHPSNVFVAGFIGTPPSNFFDCNLMAGIPCTLDTGEFRYPLPEHVAKAAKKSTSDVCILGVRPQDVLVYKNAKEKKGLVKARLEVVEPLGDKQILDLKVGDYLVKALVSPDFKAEMGDELWIDFPADKIYIFDKKTGEALT